MINHHFILNAKTLSDIITQLWIKISKRELAKIFNLEYSNAHSCHQVFNNSVTVN